MSNKKQQTTQVVEKKEIDKIINNKINEIKQIEDKSKIKNPVASSSNNLAVPAIINKFGKEYHAFLLYADFTNADKTFEEKYGDINAPIQRRTSDNQFVNSKYNAWFRFDVTKRKLTKKIDSRGIVHNIYEYEQDPTDAYKTLLKYSTLFLPHEEVQHHLFRALDNLNKNLEYGKLTFKKFRDSHKGYTRFWEVLSDKRHDVQKGDIVQFGICLRNGIGTGIALGGDLWSYRLVCQNGAILRDSKLGSFTSVHKGTTEKMIEELVDGIAHTLSNYKTLLDNYKIWTETKLTQQKLLQIVKKARLPLKYLPDKIVEVKTRRDDKELKKPLIKLADPNANLWDFFNGVTEPLTKAAHADRNTDDLKKISYNVYSKRTTRLHKALILAAAPIAK